MCFVVRCGVRDKDGALSSEDLRLAFASIGEHYSPLELEELMREVSGGSEAAVAVHPHLNGVVDVATLTSLTAIPPPAMTPAHASAAAAPTFPPATSTAASATAAAATVSGAAPAIGLSAPLPQSVAELANQLQTSAPAPLTLAEFMAALSP